MSRWAELVSRAERLLGCSAGVPFINVAPLLRPEAAALAARVRSLDSAPQPHPFLTVARACLRGQPSKSLLFKKDNQLRLPQNNRRPSGGLIILLVGQSCAVAPSSSSRLLIQHRSLAELFETVHVAISLHKSLVPLPEQQAKCGADRKNLELGNKLAVLFGDALLAAVSTTLAKFHNAQVVDEVSESIGHMTEAQFSALLAHSPSTQRGGPPVWLDYVGLARGSILGSCCHAAAALLPRLSPNPGAQRLGWAWACLDRLLQERDFHQRRWSAPERTGGYTECGLCEPTLLDAVDGESPERVLDEYRFVGEQLSSNLSQAFTEFQQQQQSQQHSRASLSAVQVLGEMVRRLCADVQLNE